MNAKNESKCDDSCRRMRRVSASINFIARTRSMKRVIASAWGLARTPRPLVIHGELATGRRSLARWVHTRSGREQGPFRVLRCCGLTERPDLECRHMLNDADEGTLVVDTHGCGGKIAEDLRWVLSQQRTGAHGEPALGTRIIILDQTGATNTPELVDNPGRLAMPPLRERVADMPELIRAMGQEISRDLDVRCPEIAPDVFDACEAHSWPGNFGEFKAALRRALVVAANDPVIGLQHLPRCIRSMHMEADIQGVSCLADVERRVILHTLRKFGGRRGVTARSLGISRSTLHRRLRELGE